MKSEFDPKKKTENIKVFCSSFEDNERFIGDHHNHREHMPLVTMMASTEGISTNKILNLDIPSYHVIDWSM